MTQHIGSVCCYRLCIAGREGFVSVGCSAISVNHNECVITLVIMIKTCRAAVGVSRRIEHKKIGEKLIAKLPYKFLPESKKPISDML